MIKWKKFPIEIICTIIFLILGFCFELWHPGWLVFMLIPLYYALYDWIKESKKD